MGSAQERAWSGPARALFDWTERLPAGLVLAVGLVAVAIVATVDQLAGARMSFSVFYLLPVVAVASRAGPRVGTGMAVVTALTWLSVELRSLPDPGLFAPLWNASMRFLVFVLVVGLVAALRSSAVHERALSRRDQLTGLPNGRAFYERAEHERRRALRSGAPLTLAYVDIDDFKQVNDTLGHAAGDEMLLRTGLVFDRTLRDVDVAARLGGDEFAVLLPGIGLHEAEVALRRLTDELRREASDQGWPIGFSVGSATYLAMPGSVDEMVRDADALMYEVKRAGKGAVRHRVLGVMTLVAG